MLSPQHATVENAFPKQRFSVLSTLFGKDAAECGDVSAGLAILHVGIERVSNGAGAENIVRRKRIH